MKPVRNELRPYEHESELPVDEDGDRGSFQREPEYGDPEAAPPELERLDVTAADVELELELTDDEPPA